MRSSVFLLFLFFSLSSSLMAQEKSAYALFDGRSKPLKYKKLLKQAAAADVICFGELHNNPIAHWLQWELLNDLIEIKGSLNLVVGAEMLETHQQQALSDYVGGFIDRKAFESEVTLWSNYATDYRPVVENCRENGIPFIATNPPRSYARQVSQQGLESLDTLPEKEKALLAPLPIEVDYELPSYAAMKEMLGGHGGGMDPKNFIGAQAIKDATMAHFILQNWEAGKLFYHLNGAYHSDHREGIVWYLKQAQPELNVFTLTVAEQAAVKAVEEEHQNKADVIILVPASMTKTYLSGFE
ncbi:MAG: ChaN family lipoprotein [Bacteroidota bacterium]